ncbi:thioredoxin domain-containing protein [Sphingobacterium deserti]|uniref:Rhodanese domain-containing protein n=1 Tax=Sphingobacterium deserti TaxID=1229276 RepID=A0A0B8T6Q8_9SPHI|nr:thioredoxin domain-containing protein [Sphingobacterium deserti]KGE13814.1 rhodanese domain-containing protein [Sphingobacterium deserti]
MKATIFILTLSFITHLGFGQIKDFKTNVVDFFKHVQLERSPQILDARSLEEYEQAHLPSAIQIDQQAADFERKIGKLDKGSPVFIYSIQTGRSQRLAEHLSKLSFHKIYVLSPGIAAWVGSGYPLVVSETNEKRISLEAFHTALTADEYVLVSFGSNYCPPCKKVIPVLDSLQRRSNDLRVVKVEIDVNPDIIKAYGVKTIPTTTLYRSGTAIWTKTGIPTVDEIWTARHEKQ